MLETLTLNNFRGMNRLSNRFNMSPELAWDIQNGYIKKDVKSGLGIIKQRSGITKLNTTDFTNACKFIYEAKWSAGGTDVIIREGTRWAIFDGVDTFDDLDTDRTDGVRGQCAMFDNQLIMVDGGKARKSTGGYVVTDLSSDAAMPADSDAVHVHNHKVWLNSIAAPMKAYYSKSDSANAADSWSAAGDAGSLDFSKILPQAGRLLGFATFAENFLLFIFTRYVVVYSCGTDPSAFAIQQIIPLNCISGHGVQQIGNDLAVCSLEGVNSFRSSMTNQDLDIDDLSRYVAPLYRDLINPLADRTVVSVGFSHSLNHLYVGIPGTDPTILVYSVDIQNFVGRWTGFSCNCFCERVDGTMLVGGTGYVYTMNSGTSDDGTAIEFSYDFPALYAKDGSRNKSFRQIEGLVNHEGSPILTINYAYLSLEAGDDMPSIQKTFTSQGVQWDADDALWDSAEWAGSMSQRFLSSDLVGRGKAIVLSLSNNILDSNIEISYLVLRYKLEDIKVR